MLAFLLAVLVFALGVGHFGKPAVTPNEIIENLDDVVANVSAPQGNPTIPPQNFAGQSENNHNTGVNGTGENGDSNSNGSGNNQNNQSANSPDTTLVATYNTAGGVVLDQVAQVAVEKSPVLDPCTGETNPCQNPSGPGNSQNAPAGQPNNGQEQNSGKPDSVPPTVTPPVTTPTQTENGLTIAQSHKP